MSELYLEDCGLQANSIEELANILLPNLTSLGLSSLHDYEESNPIGNEGVRYLKKITSLSYLNMRDTGITDAVLENIFNFNFSSLKELRLSKWCGM